MPIDFDPAKSERNARERRLPFERAAYLDWSSALVIEDVRREYRERRYVATGRLDGRVHVLCFVPLPGGIRVISFRKANPREVRRYEEATTPDE